VANSRTRDAGRRRHIFEVSRDAFVRSWTARQWSWMLLRGSRLCPQHIGQVGVTIEFGQVQGAVAAWQVSRETDACTETTCVFGANSDIGLSSIICSSVLDATLYLAVVTAWRGAKFGAMARRFQDDLVSINSARLRALGVITWQPG
jgi:hypothetical protein